jgi:hypothetical protein
MRRRCHVCGAPIPPDEPPVPVVDARSGERQELPVCSTCLSRPSRLRHWGWKLPEHADEASA